MNAKINCIENIPNPARWFSATPVWWNEDKTKWVYQSRDQFLAFSLTTGYIGPFQSKAIAQGSVQYGPA